MSSLSTRVSGHYSTQQCNGIPESFPASRGILVSEVERISHTSDNNGVVSLNRMMSDWALLSGNRKRRPHRIQTCSCRKPVSLQACCSAPSDGRLPDLSHRSITKHEDHLHLPDPSSSEQPYQRSNVSVSTCKATVTARTSYRRRSHPL